MPIDQVKGPQMSRIFCKITHGAIMQILKLFSKITFQGGGDGSMDLASGVFTCLTAGHYTVSISCSMLTHNGKSKYA